MVIGRALLALAFLAVLPSPLAAQDGPLADVPATVPSHLRAELLRDHAALSARRDQINAQIKDFNGRCDGIPLKDPRVPACDAEKATLTTRLAAYGLEKRSFNAAVATASIVVTDSMTVDARVEVAGSELVAQVPELRGSPGAVAMAKGFQALKSRDWTLVLAWWQTAQLRDPSNAAIARAVALAQSTIDFEKRGGKIPAAIPQPPGSAPSGPPPPFVNPKRPAHANARTEAEVRELEGILQFISDYMRRNPR